MSQNKTKGNIPLITQICYGIGVSYAIVDQIFSQWVLYFYLPPASSSLKPVLAPLFLSLALVISRCVDMITDPVIGFLSDKVNTRWGRRIPFIAVGAIPLAISTVAFFYPPESHTFYYLALVGSLFFLFYTIVGAPYNAMIPEIGQNTTDRLNLSTWQSIFRLVYTAIAMIAPGMLIKYFGQGDELHGVRAMIITLCVICVIGNLITVIAVPETKYSLGVTSKATFGETIKITFGNKAFRYYLLGLLLFFTGFNNLRATMNYIVKDIMGYTSDAYLTIASVILFGTAALCFLPTNKIAKRYGYRKVQLVCLTMMAIFTIMLFFIGKIIPNSFGFVIFALIGMPIAGSAFILPPAMLSEISAKMSRDSGCHIEGICFGIQGFFLKMAFMISILILPIVLVSGSGISIISAITGVTAGVSQSGIYMTTIVSAILFVLSFICYYMYEEE